MPNIAIKVENLSKRYRIGLKEELPETFVGAITSWLKAPFQNFRDLRKLSHFDDDPRRGKCRRVVDFSGVEKFIDTTVKRYSSGMQVRLANLVDI